MLDSLVDWILLIAGIILICFNGLGLFIFVLIEQRIEKWFVLGVLGSIGLIILGLL